MRASHRKPREWNNVHDHLSKNSLSMLFHPSGDLKESYKCCVEFGSAKLPNQKYAQHCPILDSYPGWDLWGVKETKGWQDNFWMQFVFSPWGISLYFGILINFLKRLTNWPYIFPNFLAFYFRNISNQTCYISMVVGECVLLKEEASSRF